MKIVKRLFVILVLCLAVIGAFSLLKKAPKLDISEDDVRILEQELGKSSSTKASREGLSGVLMNVEGMPPLDAVSVSEGSSTPPASFGIPASSLPTHLNSFQTTDEAPAFASVSEAPAFIPGSEAPAFAPATPSAPIASPYIAPDNTPAPPPLPIPAEAPAFMPAPAPSVQIPAPVPPSIDVQSPEPLVAPPTAQITPPYSPFADPPTPPFEIPPPVPEPPPQAWNGPATEVINLPSSVHYEPQRDFVVSATPVKRLPIITEQPADSFDNTSAVPLFVAMAAQQSEKNHSVSGNEVKPTEKRSGPTSERYRQTSVRQDVAFSSGAVNDAEPVISFSQQKPVSSPPPEPFPVEAPTIVETEVIPFVEPKDEPVHNTIAPARVQADIKTDFSRQPTSTIRETDQSEMLRPTVTRFVKAQGILANSGDPIKMRNAFIQLSKLYELPELNNAERVHMRPTLDRLALSIIYSRHLHILEPPHIVKPGDTVESVAASIDISPALLVKINGLSKAQPLETGSELKIIVGRFDAKVSVSRREITLILGGLYAGCFPVALGERIENIRGEFYVNSKTGSLHERTLTLNNGITIRGVDRPRPGDLLATTIRLTEKDAGELFDILTEQSIIVFED